MSVRIIAVGKKHESWVSEGIGRYEKRLAKPFDAEWVLLPHSSQEGSTARQDESERIRARIKEDDFVVLLDERGKNHTSEELSDILRTPLESSRSVVLVIGGAYGVTDEFRESVNSVWSLSRLVFPHQLVRLIVAEQLYRAQEIYRGKPYHHA